MKLAKAFFMFSDSLVAFIPPSVILALFVPVLAKASSCEQVADPTKSLLINNLKPLSRQVLNPGGKWHFSTLIKNLLPANAGDAEFTALIHSWFSQIIEDQYLPSETLNGRPDVKRLILKPWQEASKLAREARGLHDNLLEADLAPFALAAIVNRQDLRDRQFCQSDAGQGRFVFRTLKAPTRKPSEVPPEAHLIFNLIFEYQLPTGAKSAFHSAQEWAFAWDALKDYPCELNNCMRFQSQLELLTDQFTDARYLAGSTAERRLLTVRTNDVLRFPGELREFAYIAADELSNQPAQLALAATAKTPSLSMIGSQDLGQWVLDHRVDVLREVYDLPSSLVGFASSMPRQFKWTFPNLSDLPQSEFEALRFTFSKNTCNGCHSFEHSRIPTVDGAYHISPAGELSDYLTLEELPRRSKLHCETRDLPLCLDQKSRQAFRPKAVH